MKLLYVLLFFIVANVCSADEICGGGRVADIWLDIVIVADNSQRMRTFDFASDVQRSIDYIFQRVNFTRTRVGFVTYNSVATVNADLNKFKSYDDLMQGVYNSYNWDNMSPEKTSFIATGLTSAAELLQVQGSDYGHVNNPKVIIVYASLLNRTELVDPLLVANTLKSAGITIFTIAVDTDNNGVIQKQLVPIASPGFAFELSRYYPSSVVDALINVNCFCPPGWTQLHDTYYNETRKFTSCFQFIGAPTSWNTAKLGCRNLWPGNSYLATEDDDRRKKFILEVVRNNSASQQTPLQFHIGLYMLRGDWVWDDPYGGRLIDWDDWMPNYPVVSSTMTAVMNVQNSAASGWQNIDPMKVSAGYVCESVACSANNFCDANWNTKKQT